MSEKSKNVKCAFQLARMKSMGVTQLELDQAYAKYEPKYHCKKEDYFALVYLSKELKKDPDEIAFQVAFCNNDYGIDAFRIDRELHNLYLYQFKWSKNHDLFKSSFERLISDGMERIFGDPLQDEKQNQLLLQLKDALRENKAIIDRVFVHFIFNGDPEDAERSAVLDNLREELENKKYLIDQYFDNRKVDLTFEFKSNETKKLASATHVTRTYQYNINYSNFVPHVSPSGEKLFIGFMRLMDLYGMYRDMGIRFFERNIRAGLSADNPPNRAIRDALKRIVFDKQMSPELFAFHHNGVTLAAEMFDTTKSPPLIVEPRLLNGAQTVTSLAKFIELNEGNPSLKANQTILESIPVLAKIVCTPSKDSAARAFITNVTISNNKQNPVEPWNLRANDDVQCSFQDKFSSDLRIYYERQENAFQALRDSELEEIGVDPEQGKAIKMKPLAQTFLAVQGEIDKMSRLNEVFEPESTYTNTFRKSYLECDTRKIVLAYKIQYRLNWIIEEMVKRGPNKYFFIYHARNLVWALLIQAILNDENLSQLCEDYGTTLSMDTNYSGYLQELATKIVRPIINSAVESSKRYVEMLEGDDPKYNFLHTKEIYQRCKDLAGKRPYGWSKKSF
ncbi:MAG: AIPR family protein [Nitrososphaerota archaeon]|nr:AIPR family protein [Nitrososphaerota archaeon]